MISDRYVVGEVVGTGAFATVYRAHDPRLDSPVAIKVLAENWSADPDVCERFGREATLLRRVRSDRRGAPLVEVFDIDQTHDGRPFFVMSFADRGTVAERFVEGQPWPESAILDVVITLGDGLHALHAAGIVHRDIKPSNLLYASQADAADGEHLLIGDLGLAKDLLTDTTDFTVAGGTPGYMAPEQQKMSSSVSPAADVYGASVIVCELLSGQSGLDGIDLLPAAVRSEVLRGTASTPTDRHGSIAEWRDAVLAGLAGGPMSANQITPPSPPPPSPPPSPPSPPAPDGRWLISRWFRPLVAAAVATVLALGGLIVLANRGPDIAIDGPNAARVGESVFLRADVPAGGSHTWTVAGTEVDELDLRLTPQTPGTIVVQLDYTEPDGGTIRVDHTIVVADGG